MWWRRGSRQFMFRVRTKGAIGRVVLVPGPGLQAELASVSSVSKVLSRQRRLLQSVSQEQGVQVDDDRSEDLPSLPSSAPEAAPAKLGQRYLVDKSGGPALLEPSRPTLAQVAALAGVSAKTASPPSMASPTSLLRPTSRSTGPLSSSTTASTASPAPCGKARRRPS